MSGNLSQGSITRVEEGPACKQQWQSSAESEHGADTGAEVKLFIEIP